jgi:GNAT superfamily N-acetyltransferase
VRAEAAIAVRPLSSVELKAVSEELPERTPAAHRRRLTRQELGDLVYLVAWRTGRPVGMVMLATQTREEPQWRDRFGCAEVWDLFVPERHRRLGIGRALMEELERVAAARGFRRVGLSTGTADDRAYAAARSLYEAMDYRDVATGPWIESWSWQGEDGRRHTGVGVLGSYFLKELDALVSRS